MESASSSTGRFFIANYLAIFGSMFVAFQLGFIGKGIAGSDHVFLTIILVWIISSYSWLFIIGKR
jgi:hypothetical protein